MNASDVRAINAILSACTDFEGGITPLEDAVDAWEAQGSPMVEVPDREALEYVAGLVDEQAHLANEMLAMCREHGDRGGIDFYIDLHGNLSNVAAFLGSLTEGE